jgi:hypothetical protein
MSQGLIQALEESGIPIDHLGGKIFPGLHKITLLIDNQAQALEGLLVPSTREKVI